MSAELLRRAAKEMRERAEAAVLACGDEPWRVEFGYPGYDVSNTVGVRVIDNGAEETAEHVASWHPAVAVAVAGLLDEEAYGEENGHFDASHLALAVARAYLGEAS